MHTWNTNSYTAKTAQMYISYVPPYHYEYAMNSSIVRYANIAKTALIVVNQVQIQLKIFALYLNYNAIYRSSGFLAFQKGQIFKNWFRIDEDVMKNVANYNVTIYNEQSGVYLCVCVCV